MTHPLPEPITIHVCYTNSDLTEGKGWQIPFAYAELYSTALRLAEKKGVMGSDAEVRSCRGFRIGNQVYGPVHLEPATAVDQARDHYRINREAAVAKARAAGLTEDEILLIRSGGQ